MREFTAQDAVRPWWDPALKARAVRVFGIAAVLLAVLAAAGTALAWVVLDRRPLLLLLLGILPLIAAIGALTVAVIVQFSGQVGRLISRYALLIFLAAVVGLVLFTWAVSLLIGYVDGMVTSAGGHLSVAAIQEHLVPGSPANSWAAIPAYLLWPVQFQLLRDIIGVIALVGFVSILASFGIWWERKVAGRMQSRLGPMRVGGWHGWAQSMADGLKLLQKEDIILPGADRPIFRFAPYLAFIPVLAAFIALPFGLGWVFRDLDVGLIFILSMLGIGVVGVLLAGWASNNKWSVYGSMRIACQMVSYEIPMGMSLLVPIMTAGTLRLSAIGELQSGGLQTWLAFANPFTSIAAVTYFVAALASCKRSPFDLPEAESELVAGYLTEYSGYRWALFFFAEYAEMFVVAAIATILFFGAWNSPLPARWGEAWLHGPLWKQALYGIVFSGPLWFLAKSMFLFFVQIWLRWTLPRVRLDQVMYACVQVLLPLTMVVLLGSTIWGLLVAPDMLVARAVRVLLSLVAVGAIVGFIAIMLHGYSNRRRLVGSQVVNHLPGA